MTPYFFVIGACVRLRRVRHRSASSAPSHVSVLWPLARRRVARLGPRERARLLLAVRLLPYRHWRWLASFERGPAVLPLVRVAHTTEMPGFILEAFAVVGFVIGAAGVVRLCRVLARTRRVVRTWSRSARPACGRRRRHPGYASLLAPAPHRAGGLAAPGPLPLGRRDRRLRAAAARRDLGARDRSLALSGQPQAPYARGLLQIRSPDPQRGARSRLPGRPPRKRPPTTRPWRSERDRRTSRRLCSSCRGLRRRTRVRPCRPPPSITAGASSAACDACSPRASSRRSEAGARAALPRRPWHSWRAGRSRPRPCTGRASIARARGRRAARPTTSAGSSSAPHLVSGGMKPQKSENETIPALLAARAAAAAALLILSAASALAFEGRVVLQSKARRSRRRSLRPRLERLAAHRPVRNFTWEPTPSTPFEVLVVLPGGRYMRPVRVLAIPAEGPVVI